MLIITRQSLAESAPHRFKEQYEQYRGSKNWRGLDHGVIIDKLQELPQPIDPDEVDVLIGNDSWTSVPNCHECGNEVDLVVQLGQEPDYESSTACICLKCLNAAIQLIEESQ